MRSCPRSSCGSKWNWPRPDSSDAARHLPTIFCGEAPAVHRFQSADDIVCHNMPLYKARADGPFFVRLARTDGLALEKLKNYRPSEKEPFMNDRQRDYFRAKLLAG